MQTGRRILLLLLGLSLGGCLTIGVGPLTIGPSENSGLPLLYADPGTTIVRADGSRVWYEPGMVLLQGDTIRTQNGQAVIDFDDGQVVALQSNTHIRLGSIRLFFGELFTRIEKLTQRGGARVETDELTASVEGTEFSVKRNATADAVGRGTTRVTVRRGNVRCDPVEQSTWSAVVLGPNDQFDVRGWRTSPAVKQVDAHAETRWADEVIERLLRPRSNAPSVGVHIPIGGTSSGGHHQDDY